MSDEIGGHGGARLFLFLSAFFGVFGTLSRYDGLAAKIPGDFMASVGAYPVLLVPPLMFLCAFADMTITASLSPDDEWKASPLGGNALALLFMFGAVTMAQVIGFDVGPVSPTPPESFPEPQRMMWFIMFSLCSLGLFRMAMLDRVGETLEACVELVAKSGVVVTSASLMIMGAVVSGAMYAIYHFGLFNWVEDLPF